MHDEKQQSTQERLQLARVDSVALNRRWSVLFRNLFSSDIFSNPHKHLEMRRRIGFALLDTCYFSKFVTVCSVRFIMLVLFSLFVVMEMRTNWRHLALFSGAFFSKILVKRQEFVFHKTSVNPTTTRLAVVIPEYKTYFLVE